MKLLISLGFCLVILLSACKQKEPIASLSDFPRISEGVIMRDVTFRSDALHRDMTYRVFLPKGIAEQSKLPAVYLLHGGGGNFRDWSNYSDVSRFAKEGMILVMPEGYSSYYVNAATRPQDRYEDYIVHDLVADAESRFPISTDRINRAIVGVSMGGIGAITLALKHPDLYIYAGGISPAIDVPSRPFSIKRPLQWRDHAAIFGPWESQTRHSNDPFVLARSKDPNKAPYIFLSCGEQEGLMPANRAFAALLKQEHFRYEFHASPGGHDWNQWNNRLTVLFQSVSEHKQQ
jgi:putative tributyrin esterase